MSLENQEEAGIGVKENAEVRNHSNSGDEGWIRLLKDTTKSSDGKSKRSKAEIVADLHNTKIKEGIDPDKFVWVRNNWFSGKKGTKSQQASNFFPARICEGTEGLLSSWVKDPLPDNEVVVEYISAPKREPATPKFVGVERAWCVPYNEDIHEATAGKKGGRQKTLMETGNLAYQGKCAKERWNTAGLINMANYLGQYYTKDKAIIINDAIVKKAQQYLNKSLDIGDTGSDSDDAGDAHEEVSPLQSKEDSLKERVDSCDESEDEAMSSFIASNSPSDKNHSNRKRKGVNAMTLNPGDWISYINRMFGTIVYTRIVEIKPAEDADGRKCKQRLVLENGNILKGEDDIRLMEKILTGPEKGQCDKQSGSGYILIKDFVLKTGHDFSLKTIHHAASTMGKANKLDVNKLCDKGGGGSVSVRSRWEPGFVDTQSDDGDILEDTVGKQMHSKNDHSTLMTTNESTIKNDLSNKRTVGVLQCEDSESSDDEADGLRKKRLLALDDSDDDSLVLY